MEGANDQKGKKWTRDELILAFNLYCKTPFGRIHIRNPEIVALGKLLGRSVSSVSWKLANFASLDPILKDRDIIGATHGSKEDRNIWTEFSNNWEDLAYESETLLSQLSSKKSELETEHTEDSGDYTGYEREGLARNRIKQSFFRTVVLAAYDHQCAITGIAVPELLIASHIVPWSIDGRNRLNPRNGICLNALHDRAFDKGLITIDKEFRVLVSRQLMSRIQHKGAIDFMVKHNRKQIGLPKKFPPDVSFLTYHNENIFLGE
jgi:putative restriction endonuclease